MIQPPHMIGPEGGNDSKPDLGYIPRLWRFYTGNGLLVLLAAGVWALVLISAKHTLGGGDLFYLLSSGRLIMEQGLPSVDTLTWASAGSQWVNQQWLAQVIVYGVGSKLGAAGIVGLTALCLTIAISSAASVARRLGAFPERILLITIILALVIISFSTMRAQSFAFALYGIMLVLLLRDYETPRRRYPLAVVAILVFWANLHGSVLLGVALAGAAIIFSAQSGRRRWPEAALWLALYILSIGATPYIRGLPLYYQKTAGNSDFAMVVSEWMPATLAGEPWIVAPALVAIAMLAARPRLLPGFASVALLATSLAPLLTLRHAGFFLITAIAFTPPLLDAIWRVRKTGLSERLSPYFAFAGAACFPLAVVLAFAINTPPSALSQQPYSIISAEVVREDPSALILAPESISPAMLWQKPELGGNFVFDARFELLPPGCLLDIQRVFMQAGTDQDRSLDGIRLVLAQKGERAPLAERARAEGTVLWEDEDLILVDRGPQAKEPDLCRE